MFYERFFLQKCRVGAVAPASGLERGIDVALSLGSGSGLESHLLLQRELFIPFLQKEFDRRHRDARKMHAVAGVHVQIAVRIADLVSRAAEHANVAPRGIGPCLFSQARRSSTESRASLSLPAFARMSTTTMGTTRLETGISSSGKPAGSK